jgi:hypothetical protein
MSGWTKGEEAVSLQRRGVNIVASCRFRLRPRLRLRLPPAASHTCDGALLVRQGGLVHRLDAPAIDQLHPAVGVGPLLAQSPRLVRAGLLAKVPALGAAPARALHCCGGVRQLRAGAMLQRGRQARGRGSRQGSGQRGTGRGAQGCQLLLLES